MFYYLYEIKNKINNKIYIGVHKTDNINDGYMGSGRVITKAIGKYGRENFTKTILETFNDSESMYAREKEIVTSEFLLREDVYNIRCGGHGGFDWINSSGIDKFRGRSHTEETKDKIRKKVKGRARSLEVKEKISYNHWVNKDPEKQREHAKYAASCHRPSRKGKTTAAKGVKTGPQVIVECPKCGKTGGVRAMHRYHFERCKAV